MEQVLLEWIPAWYVSGLPAAFVLGCALSTSREVAQARDRLRGTLRNRADLHVLRRAIVLSLRAGAVMAVAYALFLALTCVLVMAGAFPLREAVAHVIAFSVLILPTLPVLMSSESGLRGLAVIAPDPGVERTYAKWLNEWRELRLNLSEPAPIPMYGRVASSRPSR